MENTGENVLEVIASQGKARNKLALDIKHAMRNSNIGNDNVIDGPSFIDTKIQGFSGVNSKTIENARLGTKMASGAPIHHCCCCLISKRGRRRSDHR